MFLERCIMKQNVSTTDKIIRIILGLVFAGLGIFISGWFFIGTIILGVTAAIGYCGLYSLIGINTCKIKVKK
jgi:hypothetical protein